MAANRIWIRDRSAGREHEVPVGQYLVASQRRLRPTLRLHLNAHTKADRLRVAQHASSRGFFSRSDTEGWVRCPMCGDHVVAFRQVIEYKLETWGAALD